MRKPLILLLHGGPDHKEEWNDVIELLEGYHCLALDLPGFGLTGSISEDFGYSLAAQVQYLSQRLEAEGIKDKVLIAGHDIGAILALAWASENEERVQGMLLMNTVADKDFQWHSMGKIWGHPVWGPLFMFFVNNNFFKLGFSRDFPELSQKDVASVIKGLTKTSRKNLLRLFRKMTAPEYFELWDDKFREVVHKVPTTVLWGKKDPLVAEEYAYKLGGAVIMIDDCGHWVPRQKPDLVAQQIKNMLT